MEDANDLQRLWSLLTNVRRAAIPIDGFRFKVGGAVLHRLYLSNRKTFDVLVRTWEDNGLAGRVLGVPIDLDDGADPESVRLVYELVG